MINVRQPVQDINDAIKQIFCAYINRTLSLVSLYNRHHGVCCRRRPTCRMQPSGLPVYCSATEQRTNFTTDPRHVSCASASVTTSRQLTELGHSTDHAGYQPRRLDCAGNGSDVTSSRDRPSSASSSSQSVDDASAPRSSLNSDVTTTYVNRTTAEFDAPVSDVTSAHNGYDIYRH